jgi:hypothetical protein
LSVPPRPGEKVTEAVPSRPRGKRAAPPRPGGTVIKYVPPRPAAPLSTRYAKEYWDKVDNLFYRTVGYAERAFRINVNINIVVVTVGIVLLAYSIIYSWIHSLDVYSVAFGSLGVIDFIATFFITPQRNIEQIVGDLTQTQMLYRTYYTQLEAVQDWDREHPNKTLQELTNMNKHLEDITDKAAQEIEDLIGKDKKEKQPTSTQTESRTKRTAKVKKAPKVKKTQR